MTTYIWSIDDAGLGGADQVESLERTGRFFEERGVRATWFTVPKPRGQALSADWIQALRRARDAGHDLQLHGLTHGDCYEFGPPAWPATSILPTLQGDFDRQRAELLTRYTVEQLRARLEQGMTIFAETLEVVPTVFRAPCGAISKPLFAALQQVGIGVHSVMYISATGYAHLPHNSGRIEQQWTDQIPHRPFRWYSDVIEVPMVNEYTWRGAGQRTDEFVALARQDLAKVAQVSPVAVILMHTHGIAADYEHAFRLIDAVMDEVGRQPGATWSTLGEAAAAGVLSEAAVDQGPDILPI